jgi:hypothetical protein
MSKIEKGEECIMRARRRIAWWEGALVASVPMLFAGGAFANQVPSPASQQPGCEDTGVVHFAVGSSKLNSQSKRSLDEVATQLQQNDELKATIQGFTDPSGSDDVNQVLSQRRAAAVETYLSEKGVEANRVTTEGHGEAPSAGEKPASSERVAVVTTCQATPAPEPAATTPAEETPAPAPAPAPEATAPVETPPPPPVETPPTPAPPAMASAEGVHARAYEPRPLSGIGMGITVGAGVMDFWHQRARSFTDPGVTWNATATIGTRLPVGLDLSYVGSSQNITLPGFSTDSYMLGQGAEAALRLQYPHGWVRPYAFGGIGWRQLSIRRQNLIGTGFQDFDNQGTVPFGAGLAIGQVNGIMFDLHGTGRLTFDDELLSNVLQNQGEHGHTQTWDVTARIGGEF